MNFKKLPLSVAVAASVGTGYVHAGEYEYDMSSVDIDKSIVYNQNIGNTGHILTLGMILVDSSAVAVSEVKQSSEYNQVYNEFDTLNDASVADNVLNGATGNIGVNVAAGDNNVQQNSVAIANASSNATSVDLNVDFTQGETNHFDEQYHEDYHQDYQKVDNYDEKYDGAWGVDGSVGYSHSTTERVTVDEWEVGTKSELTLEGDAVGIAGAASGAHTEGMAAWGEYGVGGDSAGGGVFLNDKDIIVPGEGEAGPTVIEGHETQGTYSASTEGRAAGSAEFTEDESLLVDVSGFAGQSYSEYYDGAESYNEEANSSYDSNATHDDDYRLNVAFDADFVFGGAADAETFSEQYAYLNTTINNGVLNTASVGDEVGVDAAGNIGINVAAGNSNVQANQLALANNDGVLSTATASSYQVAADNYTENNSLTVYETKSVEATMSGVAYGTYEGYSDQANNVYPDIWEGAENQPHSPHPTTESFVYHMDLDSNNQGAEHAPDDHAAYDPDGSLLFREAGELALDDIQLAGTVYYREARYMGHENIASLGDNALSGASGNIGVNIAAGTNNLQGNALAISNASVPIAPAPPAGGE